MNPKINKKHIRQINQLFSKEIIRQSQNEEGEKGIKAILITDLKNTFFYKYPSIQHKILHYITGKRELGSDLENPDTKEFIFSCINGFEEKQIQYEAKENRGRRKRKGVVNTIPYYFYNL